MTAGRARRTLGETPEDADSLESFPARIVPARGSDEALWRVTRETHVPWWFSSNGGGRFDLEAPRGTCYLAFDPITALLEVIGPRLGGAVSRDFFTERVIRSVSPPKRGRMADSTSRRALGYGVTPEIGVIVPYGLPRRWAERWREAGFDGVVYWARHDPQRSKSLALFGNAGERTNWPPGTSRPIDKALIARLENDCGIEVLDVPRLDQLNRA